MCGYTRLDRIRNVVFREQVGVEKLRETRLRWFVRRKSANAPGRRCEVINLLHCRRGRGRPNKSWSEVIRSDMKVMGLTEDMTQDRNLWRSRSKIVAHR